VFWQFSLRERVQTVAGFLILLGAVTVAWLVFDGPVAGGTPDVEIIIDNHGEDEVEARLDGKAEHWVPGRSFSTVVCRHGSRRLEVYRGDTRLFWGTFVLKSPAEGRAWTRYLVNLESEGWYCKHAAFAHTGVALPRDLGAGGLKDWLAENYRTLADQLDLVEPGEWADVSDCDIVLRRSSGAGRTVLARIEPGHYTTVLAAKCKQGATVDDYVALRRAVESVLK
jgi:hypothetical protein